MYDLWWTGFSPSISFPLPLKFRQCSVFISILILIFLESKLDKTGRIKKEMLFFSRKLGSTAEKRVFFPRLRTFVVLERPCPTSISRHPSKPSLFPRTFYPGSAVDKATAKLASQHVECDMSLNILLCLVSTCGLCKATVPADSVSKAPVSADALKLQRLLSESAKDLSGPSYKTI